MANQYTNDQNKNINNHELYYQKFIQPSNNSSVINNQTSVDQISLLACSMYLKSDSKFVLCPYCKQFSPTRVEKAVSYKNLLLCLFCTPTIWGAAQILRNKDLSFYDAKHYCMRCNSFLGEYSAC